jgi:hypothetical protein
MIMRAPERSNIQVEFGCVQYGGWYEVERDLVKVHSCHGSRSAQLGSTPPDILARMILRELIEEEKRQPDKL